MKRLFILTCFISIIQLTVAQEFIQEPGICTNDELHLQKYDKDPSAEAVVIYDIGQSSFSPSVDGLDLIFEHRMKIKIFSKAGLKWSEIIIPYYQENDKVEKVYEISGITYNSENDQVRRSILNPKTAFTEKAGKNWYNIKLAMPDVKEGSVIEVSYKIRSPYIFAFRNWNFQTSIPVIYSEYTTKMVPFYEYAFILQGTNKFDDTKSFAEKGTPTNFAGIDYQNMVYVFIMKNLPAFRDESFITSSNDYLIKLNFQLSVLHRSNGDKEAIITTWPKMIEDLSKEDLFGKYAKTCQTRSKEFLDTMKLTSKSNIEKAKTIEHFVKSYFKWDGYNDKYSSKSVKDLLKSKTGNCADINLFLTGMLNAAGIESYPVIGSTRSHGKINSEYPFLHYFNSVLVYAKIDSVSVLLDATDPTCKFAEIPTQYINEKGLTIQKNKVDWISLKSGSISNSTFYITLQPDPTKDSINQKCKLITTGYEAINYRNEYSKSFKTLKDNLFGNSVLPGDSLNQKGLNDTEKPFELNFTKNYALETVEDKIIISPFSSFTFTENPLKQSARNYPVDFIYKKSYAFETTIKIPKGYKLSTKPEGMKIEDDMVRIIYAATVLNNETIRVIGQYEFKKDEYQVLEYMYLKDYFNKIVDKFNEKLVLVKES